MSADAPLFAAEEEWRAEAQVARLVTIQASPEMASNRSVPLYQLGAREAFENAARHTVQPQDRP